MAPKRNATATAAGKRATPPPAMKRLRRMEPADPRLAKFELVKAALHASKTELPQSDAREMLLGSIDLALKGEPEERHEFQNTIAGMIEEVFSSVRGNLEVAFEERKKFLQEANETKSDLQAQFEAAQQALETKKQEISEQKTRKSQDEVGLKEAEAGLEKAKADARQLETLKSTLMKDQTKQASVYEQNFTRLREMPIECKKEGEKLLKPVLAMLKSMNEDSMGRGLPIAILKAPEVRGEFDNMAISAVDELLTKTAKDLEEKLAGNAEEVSRAEAATATAQQTADAASQKLSETTELLQMKEGERRECEKQLKAATAELKKHERKVEETQGELEGSETKVRDFAQVEEAFEFLRTYSTNKAEQTVVEPVAEEQAEEQPASMQEAEKPLPEALTA